MPRGILIAVEGIDGSGKTTQVDLLSAFLIGFGEPTLRSKEPTNGPWGQKIRQSAANGRMSLEDELHAFIEDRKEHVRDVINPALEDGKTVVLDRYFYSTIAYQGSRGGDPAKIAAMMRTIAPEPDAVILLDVPAETGLLRVRNRDDVENHFEGIEDLRKVRDAFRQLVTADNVTLIDGTPSVHVVEQKIVSSLMEGIFLKRHCAKHWGCDDPFNCAYRKTDTCRWALMKKRAAQLVD